MLKFFSILRCFTILYVLLFSVLFVFYFAGCKAELNEIDVFFVDPDTGDETTDAIFEVRPYIFWKPVYLEEESSTYRLDSMEVDEKRYNWFTAEIIIDNPTDHDVVLNNVEITNSYYGADNLLNTASSNISSTCEIGSEDSCEFCFPRTIVAGSRVPLMVNTISSACMFYSGDEKVYTAGRLGVTVEILSEVYGTVSRSASLFAKPRSEFSSSTKSYGMLYCDDGVTVCESKWEWNPNDLPLSRCNCNGGANCLNCEVEEE